MFPFFPSFSFSFFSCLYAVYLCIQRSQFILYFTVPVAMQPAASTYPQYGRSRAEQIWCRWNPLNPFHRLLVGRASCPYTDFSDIYTNKPDKSVCIYTPVFISGSYLFTVGYTVPYCVVLIYRLSDSRTRYKLIFYPEFIGANLLAWIC
jgi:hypothetical protein